jgi:Omp85 superfamily domain
VRTADMLKWFTMLALVATSTNVAAQSPSPAPTEAAIASAAADETSSPQESRPGTRQAAIEEQQAAKEGNLRPYVPNKGERIFEHIDTVLEGGNLRWHPFFQNAYSGGGFTLGLGHITYLGGYNFIDLRGSYTLSSYKRVEAEFVAPRLFHRRGQLSVIGGWREATQVGFYGIGPNSSKDDRTNYLFNQPYGSALLTLFPTRQVLMLRGGVEYSRWNQEPGEGTFPSVETVYTPETLPGLGAEVTYLHTQGTVGIDWRTSPGYSRRGGFYGVTLHDYNDRDDNFGFQILEYEAIQHIPLLREAWVLSFRARVQDSSEKDGQQTPFFMLPALGGGSSLRGFSSWRFRDQSSLLLQGEWRIMVNRYLDMAFFYDAGKVAPRAKDLDLDRLKDDFGFGLRFHGPFATPLRVELAKSREGLAFVFAAGPTF